MKKIPSIVQRDNNDYSGYGSAANKNHKSATQIDLETHDLNYLFEGSKCEACKHDSNPAVHACIACWHKI